MPETAALETAMRAVPRTLARHFYITQVLCALALLAYAYGVGMYQPLYLFSSLHCAAFVTWRIGRADLEDKTRRTKLSLLVITTLLLMGYSQVIFVDTFLHSLRLPLLGLGEGHPVYERYPINPLLILSYVFTVLGGLPLLKGFLEASRLRRTAEPGESGA